MDNNTEKIQRQFKIAVIDVDGILTTLTKKINATVFASQIEAFNCLKHTKFDLIISDAKDHQLTVFNFSSKLLNTINKDASFIIVSNQYINNFREKALKYNIDDFYHINSIDKLINRISILKKLKTEITVESNYFKFKHTANFIKRCIDITVSSIALLLTSPILIIVTCVLKLQDKGPVIYKSHRVGSNFKIIDVYKFRTMVVDADKKIESLKNLNAYTNNSEHSFDDAIKQSMLIDDSMVPISEDTHLSDIRNTPVFLKFKSDPRVTKFGKILRKTSVDELPQLFNVIKGDMSIVGNRPLPISEGDRLTTDEAASRFLAPAGLTGYWQVTQRGTNKISQSDRIKMDNIYARKRSFLFDITIIIKTFKALIQNENH